MTAATALLTAHRTGVRQLSSFAVIGVVSTAAYAVLYAMLRNGMGAAAANAVALLVTAVANTAANRRLTFAVTDRAGLARDHAAGLLAFAVALLITTLAIAGFEAATPERSRGDEIVVLVAANLAATLIRFLVLRSAIARPRPCRIPTAQPFERIAR